MGDSSETLLDLQNRRDAEEHARNRLLGKHNLNLAEDSMHWILSHIDCFVGQSRGNVSIKEVFLHPYAAFNDHDEDVWVKFG
jgi:hypothetical protein